MNRPNHALPIALFAFTLISNAGHAASPLTLGEEQVPPGEAEGIALIQGRIAKSVEEAQHASADGVARRDAHAKHHGCVRAEFEVAAAIPPRFRAGVLATPGEKFPAWVRYSNGDGHPSKDSKPDGRGMAVKLMNVPGEKLLEDEKDAQTQDFLAIDSPTFFTRNVADYVSLIQAVTTNGSPLAFFFPSVLPWKWHLREAVNAIRLALRPAADPLALRYWSMTPYRLGAEAIKYSMQPCAGSPAASRYKVPGKDPNRLRTAMVAHLAAEPACYDFMVQPQTDPARMPIEDPTVEWSEHASPFVQVARIRIPVQSFDTPEQQDFCEQISYTPWHSLPEHRPLGGINRARKAVYQAISKIRHGLNGRVRQEPTP